MKSKSVHRMNLENTTEISGIYQIIMNNASKYPYNSGFQLVEHSLSDFLILTVTVHNMGS